MDSKYKFHKWIASENEHVVQTEEWHGRHSEQYECIESTRHHFPYYAQNIIATVLTEWFQWKFCRWYPG